MFNDFYLLQNSIPLFESVNGCNSSPHYIHQFTSLLEKFWWVDLRNDGTLSNALQLTKITDLNNSSSLTWTEPNLKTDLTSLQNEELLLRKYNVKFENHLLQKSRTVRLSILDFKWGNQTKWMGADIKRSVPRISLLALKS